MHEGGIQSREGQPCSEFYLVGVTSVVTLQTLRVGFGSWICCNLFEVKGRRPGSRTSENAMPLTS
jgi:hypothetical protein